VANILRGFAKRLFEGIDKLGVKLGVKIGVKLGEIVCCSKGLVLLFDNL
jgi:hypothetical protein